MRSSLVISFSVFKKRTDLKIAKKDLKMSICIYLKNFYITAPSCQLILAAKFISSKNSIQLEEPLVQLNTLRPPLKP